MKSQLNWNGIQSSEIATAQDFRKPQSSLIVKLNKVWQSALAYLNASSNASSELRIWQTEEAGRVFWSAYDPVSKKSIEQVSTQELRVWLEERHYQNV